MTKYTKYLTDHIFLLVTLFGFLLGGHWLWLGVGFTIVAAIAGDFLLGDHGERPDYRFPQLLTLIMYSYLPAIMLVALVFIWTMAPGDLFGIGALATSLLGFDVLAARADTTVIDLVGGAISLGLLFAIINTVMAHELIHRTWNPVSMFFGRWFFALSGGVPFETEHVYGHHITLGQPHDASLSLRRDSYWAFYSSAPLKQIAFAWNVEKERLAKYGHSVFWPTNKMIRSALRVAVVWTVVYLLGGWLAVGMYTIAFWISKMMYEAIGYQFHHGQICAPGEPDGDRHSWNCNRLMTQVVLFNVSKHSEHHAHPNRPFHEFTKVKPGAAPLLSNGCITNALMAFFPPLFRRVMAPQLLKWDEEFATEAEKKLAAQQNAESGISALQQHGRAAHA